MTKGHIKNLKDYKPKYFLGEEINPACEKCKDDSIVWDDEITTIDEEQTSSIIIPEPVPEHPFTPKGFNHRPTSSVKPSSSVSNCSHLSSVFSASHSLLPCLPWCPSSTSTPCTTWRSGLGTWTGEVLAANACVALDPCMASQMLILTTSRNIFREETKCEAYWSTW